MKRLLGLAAGALLGCASLVGTSLAADPAPAAAESAPRISQADLLARLDRKDPGVVVLDVRTPEEFAAGHIDGAINMNVNAPDFDARVAQLDKSKPHVTYCRTGRRSTTAANKLVASKIPTYHLQGGITAWQQQGGPTTRP